MSFADYVDYTMYILGVSLLVSGYLMMLVIFLQAYNSPGQETVVSVNSAGEAKAEVILFFVLGLPLALYTALKTARLFWKECIGEHK